MAASMWTELQAELDRAAAAGRGVRLWLRDDDATAVTDPLERLLRVTGEWDIPTVLAVIPAAAQPELAARVRQQPRIVAAVHGFAHANHAPAGEKKQELGTHRPAAAVLDELALALERVRALFAGQAVPMLVPPWNRIAAELVPHLPRRGFGALSTFGAAPPHRPVPGLLQVDCQLDIIDWRGTRGCLAHEVLATRLARLVRDSAGTAPIGVLTHHLAHDDAAWRFLAELFRITVAHPAAAWSWPYPGFTEQRAPA